MKTIAVGPLLLTESCVTGGAIVAMHAVRSDSILHCFDKGLGVVGCKARLAIADERLAILIFREGDGIRAGGSGSSDESLCVRGYRWLS